QLHCRPGAAARPKPLKGPGNPDEAWRPHPRPPPAPVQLTLEADRSAVLAWLAVAKGGLAELVVLGEAVGLHATGIRSAAAPGCQFLHRERERAASRIVPSQPVGTLECLEVREAAILEALQPHATAAHHLRHLFDREEHHLAILADRGDEVAF